MQTVSQAIEIVAYVTGTQRGRANQIARALIDAGILPKSSGRNIKKIDARQMLPLLAAVAMAEKVADAPNVARSFADLPARFAQDENSEPEGTLSHFFNIAMTNQNWNQVRIELSKTAAGFTAEIKVALRNGKLSSKIDLPFWESPTWGHFCKTSFTISPEGFEVMRNLFAREDIDGMSFSLMAGVPADE
jgi:hypothetical protein